MSLNFPVKGRQGDKGDEGEQGIEGEKGEKGDTGEIGGLNRVDRGDVGGYDFTTGNFTKDNTFRELDLSGIVPENAIGVYFYVIIRTSLVSGRASFIKYGYSAGYNRCYQRVQVANRETVMECFLPLESNRKILYRFDTATWQTIDFYVTGWLIE